MRTVKYKADKEHGFQAQVYIDGKLVEHGDTSGSDESGEGSYRVSHTGRSSEEGGRFQSDEDFVDDDGDDDDDDDEDDD